MQILLLQTFSTRWRPKHVEKVRSNKICILLHHVGFYLSLTEITIAKFFSLGFMCTSGRNVTI